MEFLLLHLTALLYGLFKTQVMGIPLSTVTPAETAISVSAIFCPIIIFLLGIVINNMRNAVKSNTQEVKDVKEHTQTEIDTLRQNSNDELRQHEESNRKSHSKIYDRLEQDYVKKESLGLMLKNMSENVESMVVMLKEHIKTDTERADKRDKQHTELSKRVHTLEIKLGEES